MGNTEPFAQLANVQVFFETQSSHFFDLGISQLRAAAAFAAGN